MLNVKKASAAWGPVLVVLWPAAAATPRQASAAERYLWPVALGFWVAGVASLARLAVTMSGDLWPSLVSPILSTAFLARYALLLPRARRQWREVLEADGGATQ